MIVIYSARSEVVVTEKEGQDELKKYQKYLIRDELYGKKSKEGKVKINQV